MVKASVTTENGVSLTVESGVTVKIVDNAKDFADVPVTHWASDAIDFATSRELFAGTAETTFTLGAPMTWAVENGLITSMTDGSLNPYGLATRAQVATILQRFVVSFTE